MAGGDQRSHLRRGRQRVADLDPLHRRLQRGEEVVEDGALDQDPRARTAVLPGIAEDRDRGRRGGGLEVGVGEDHVRRLAAQLQGDALDRARRRAADRPPDLGGAGEGDLGDVGMLYEPRAAHAAGPGHHVQHALGQAGVERDPLQLQRRQRRQLRRLEDDGVAARQCRTELPGGDVEREVPRHDQADDAERLAERERLAAGDGNRLTNALSTAPA